MALQHLNGNEFNEIVLNSNKVTLVDFFATWCMPCKMLGPVLEQVAETVKDEFQLIKVDIDENMDLARKFGVMSVPTMVIVKDGNEVDRIVGFRQANQIIEVLNKHK